MTQLFFPSCNFTAANPEASRRLGALMSRYMDEAGCCRVDPLRYPAGAEAIYLCQACRATLEQRAPGQFRLRNLFDWLLTRDDFDWPDYGGLTVTVQDCWRDRDHPEIHEAVRGCLRRMNVKVAEMAENRENSVFCGNIHFEPRRAENLLLLEQTPLERLTPEQLSLLFAEQAEKYPCPDVVTYCNRCTAGVSLSGQNAIHLARLITGTY